MKKSNCVLYAVALHSLLVKKGYRAYYKIRWSDWGKFPHFLVEWDCKWGGRHVASFKPKNPIKRKRPPILFDGYVAWGDPAPKSVAPNGVSQ